MKLTILILSSFLAFFGCNKAAVTSSADIQETAQQVGDVMASIDESGGSSGAIALNDELIKKSIRNTFDRYAPNEINENMIAKLFLPQANAAACSIGVGFAGCSGNTIVRSYGGCTVGSATFSGDVTLTWGGTGVTTCALAGAGTYISRLPNFTVTGRRSAVLTVTKTGSLGQRIELVSAGASPALKFSNDGINRTFVAAGKTLFNQTSATSGDITVTGTARTNRVMNGGSLNVTNNLTSVVCNYVPTNVTWSTTTCNCPVSGSWAGTCSDGKSTSLNITGCGTASYSEGSDTQNVSFDRCGG